MTEAEEREEIQPRQIVAPEIGYKKPPPQTKSFAASTAEVTGENVRQIQRHIARAEALGNDIDRLVGTSLRITQDMLMDLLCECPMNDVDALGKMHERIYLLVDQIPAKLAEMDKLNCQLLEVRREVATA